MHVGSACLYSVDFPDVPKQDGGYQRFLRSEPFGQVATTKKHPSGSCSRYGDAVFCSMFQILLELYACTHAWPDLREIVLGCAITFEVMEISISKSPRYVGLLDHLIGISLLSFYCLRIILVIILRLQTKIDELCSSRISLQVTKSRSRSPQYHNPSILDTGTKSSRCVSQIQDQPCAFF